MQWVQKPYPSDAGANINPALGREFKRFVKVSLSSEEEGFLDWNPGLVNAFLSMTVLKMPVSLWQLTLLGRKFKNVGQIILLLFSL